MFAIWFQNSCRNQGHSGYELDFIAGGFGHYEYFCTPKEKKHR
jgi:hypothetical protein